MGQLMSGSQDVLHVQDALYSCMNGEYTHDGSAYLHRCPNTGITFCIEYQEGRGWYINNYPQITLQSYQTYYCPSHSRSVPSDGWYILNESPISSKLRVTRA